MHHPLPVRVLFRALPVLPWALNKSYAAAMKPVYAEFGADLDVATIYADALMNMTSRRLEPVQAELHLPRISLLAVWHCILVAHKCVDLPPRSEQELRRGHEAGVC
jgi:hypothetical protein